MSRTNIRATRLVNISGQLDNRRISISIVRSTQHMTRSLASILATSLLVIALWGCGSEARDSFSTGTFYYNESDGLNTLDPAKISARAPWWVGEMIYTGLVGLDSNLNPVPRLATRWEVSEDGLVWTFHIRDDVYFADDESFADGIGRQVTVHDVQYSFERVCNPATKSTGFWVFRGKVKGADRYFDARDKGEAHVPEHVE